MKYRIVERVNRCNGKCRFAVEQLINLSLNDWALCRYYDENYEPRYAIFDTVHDAETFIEHECKPIIQTIVKEIEL